MLNLRSQPSADASAPVEGAGSRRRHLRLALLGLAVVPMVVAIVVTAILLGRSSGSPALLRAGGPSEVPGEPVLVLIVLVVGAVVATVALLGYLLRPLDEIAQSKSRLQDLYRQAREDSLRDALTGLGNHRAFQEDLRRLMALFEGCGEPFSLVLMDLDDLKLVNDRDGHAAGDDMLDSMAESMRTLTRSGDRLYRVGGDEFAVLLPDTDVATAVAISERLLHFAKRPASGARPSSFSAGVSAVPAFTRDHEVLCRQADAALYWAKRHGRGLVEVFESDRDQLPEDLAAITRSAVQEVITGHLLSAVFQPIVDLRSGHILGFEGLIRPDPRGPLPDTARLFAAAAASDRTVELDVACVEAVLASARAIGPDRLLTLNLSPRTLEVKDFDAGWLLQGLYRNGISPGRVILELTERDEIADLVRLQRTFSHLQQYGLRLAADDVGAGNSGLRLLSQVQFDIVKIDLSLVHDGVRRLGARAVLRSLRDLALSQHAHVVAEGVETREQLQLIRELDIGAGQGYLLGRPDASVAATFVDVANLGAEPLITSRFGPALLVPTPVPATELDIVHDRSAAADEDDGPGAVFRPDLRSIVLPQPRFGGLWEADPGAA